MRLACEESEPEDTTEAITSSARSQAIGDGNEAVSLEAALSIFAFQTSRLL
jgi:hypothetical protein